GMGVEAEVKENTQEKYVKEAEAGGVTVKVAYLNPGAKVPQFKITLDTHEGSLDEYRLGEITTLKDSSGREYRGGVIFTTGSGHHIEALLEFKDADMESLKFAELSIKGLAGVDERVFRFELGGME
ncbi:MAG: hypothetical protein HY883_05160, partial [Deltaproteobacteria bacterium]|nr:hypothetical protein [Deltaproteobacteria bacterium]